MIKKIVLKTSFEILIISLLLAGHSSLSIAQNASIQEEMRSIKTYPFSEPNPVPVLVKDTRLYPYHIFEGYSQSGQQQKWKVIKMENDYIEVYILPEVGGKVWGAIEKSTGQEFIYRNEVLKFRNIALRGPWTSGGIEFNFGIIGHTPATATPVDYTLLKHPDGSVSCIVGNMDLPSRTHWRVQIHLPKDKAYFTTKVLWYNPSPIAHPYYNWMTGAAFATNDLEVFFPGNRYLKHSGEVKSWPIDETDRKLSMYHINNFDGHKSYHVVGNFKDFFGGYYHNSGYGFGHWAPYSDMPGQKLWLWALSRAGGIWEELLTDSDGQYVEFQAGRLLVQYSPQNQNNPIKEAGFEPYTTDQWNEIWFPVKEIGGLSEVSPYGAMYVKRNGRQLQIGINSFVQINAALEVKVKEQNIFQKTMKLLPMDVFKTTVSIEENVEFEVQIPEMDLLYRSTNENNKLKRPFHTDAEAWTSVPETDRLMAIGNEYIEGRHYEQARKQFEIILNQYPFHRDALIAMTDLYFRSARYTDGLKYITKALQLDTYDPHANYLTGNLYRASGDFINAKESFGWAARSMTYRSAANTQISEIALQEGNYQQAKLNAKRALDYNRYNINACQVLAITARKTGKRKDLEKILTELLDIDPLHHFAHFEQFLIEPTEKNRNMFQKIISNEYPDQTYLELAIVYYNRGLEKEAIQLLQMSKDKITNPLIDLWLAYLLQTKDKQETTQLLNFAAKETPAFVFPYRRETIKVLEWATAQDSDWKWKYYLALNYWAKDRKSEAKELMQIIAEKPDFAPFYISRAHLFIQDSDADADADIENDLKKALEMDKQNWRTWQYLFRFYQNNKQWDQALTFSSKAYQQFPDNFNIAIAHANSLVFSGKADTAINVLKMTRVLPSEHSRECRTLYELAHLHKSIDLIRNGKYAKAIKVLNDCKKWPENLGEGKPFDPDERMQDFMLGYCYQKQNDQEKAENHFQRVIQFTQKHLDSNTVQNYLGYVLLLKQGKKKEAQALINQISRGPHTDKPEVQWIITKAKNNKSELKRLQKQNPQIFNLYGFRLFNDIVDLFN